MSIEEQVLAEVTPDQERRLRILDIVESVLSRVREIASNMNLDVEAMLVGSVAKDTFLPSPDIDIFLLFPPDTPRDVLETKGLELGKRAIGGYEKYAEHPYIHGSSGGLEVDLVPCYRVRSASELKSAVDRTPFHTRFVIDNLKADQMDQVRLLKRFMKGIGVYGAEAKVEGFSGYLTELLIMKYGTFRSVLENASRWVSNTSLWLEARGSTRFRDALVFYDPVDSKRNVASALSLDSFALFIHACKEYLDEERIEFFFPRDRDPLPMTKIKEMLGVRGTSLVISAFQRPEILDDNLYPQARRTHEGLANLLRENDFIVLDSTYHVGEDIWFIFELQEDVLPRAMRHVGPPVWIDHSQRFLDKWSGSGLSEPFIEDGRWIVMAEREFPNAVDLLLSRVEKAALGSEFRQLKGYRVIGGDDPFEDGNEEILSSLMDKRKSWEL